MTSHQTPHPAFELVDQSHIDALNVTVEHYRHKKTGAVHYHLASDSEENVFLVALRTVPQDSTGVAHILEHTALCGSRRYPVRDPFFMMLRRSLNTFMNAFTSSDWTAYPFATQNRKDFNNLLDVYLDAVFFSRIDPLDFAQEGHRLEFDEADNSDSELVFKGVVFNEMKGAMSSINSVLWDKLCFHLFPTTTYHYNSGGDPVHIPDLTYDQLKHFYQSHYHPSNAIFMTFGNIAAYEHQHEFESKALAEFDAQDLRIAVPAEQKLPKPLQVSESYAWDDAADPSEKTHIVMGWLLGESSNLQQLLEAQLLASVLIDNSASPLMQVLETTELGSSPSPLCGLEDSMHEMVFCCGVEGSRAEHRDAVEAMVLSVIEKVANEGVPFSQLDAVLHQLELSQREVSGDGFPYGLQLILTALGPATHYHNPLDLLDLEPVLDTLREQIKDPEFIKTLARTLLLENTHRVTLVLTPDTELSEQRRTEEQQRLLDIKSSLSETQKQAIVEQAKALKARQEQDDDPGVLPKVGIEDVPDTLPELQSQVRGEGHQRHTGYGQGTNGLVYQQVISPLPSLSAEQRALLPLYTQILTEVGLGDADYLQTQQRHASEVGAIGASSSWRGAVDDADALTAYLVTSSKALGRNAEAQARLMLETRLTPRFDELARLRDLVSQQRARQEQAITGNGHVLAMTAACAGISVPGSLNHELGGLAAIRALRQLDASLEDETALSAFAEQLTTLHQHLQSTPKQLLTIAAPDALASMMDTVDAVWRGHRDGKSSDIFSPGASAVPRKQLWLGNTQVNFCARAYPTVPVDHIDAPVLTVLGGILRNGYLHRAIREQGGAYGGGASQDSSVAAFRFYSYRDPRLEDTLQDFDDSVQWLINNPPDARQIEEAVLGVISSLDKPGSPAGEAKTHFHNLLFGRSAAQRAAFRQRVLTVNAADLVRVCKTYLSPEQAHTAIVTHSGQMEQSGDTMTQMGFEILGHL